MHFLLLPLQPSYTSRIAAKHDVKYPSKRGTPTCTTWQDMNDYTNKTETSIQKKNYPRAVLELWTHQDGDEMYEMQ